MSQTNRGLILIETGDHSRENARRFRVPQAVSSAFSHCYRCSPLNARPETLAELPSTAACTDVRIELITAPVLCRLSYLGIIIIIFFKVLPVVKIPGVKTKTKNIIIIILYTYIVHQTIKLSLMRWMRILTEQECF